MTRAKLIPIFFLALACHKAKEPSIPDRLERLRDVYASRLERAADLRDSETGWLARHDCDGMIWAARYASAKGVTGVAIEAAEYPEPGKFGRRPKPWCWDGADYGSKSTWSRDMAVAGLIPWALLTGRRDVLERHAAYGRAHSWFMGEPSHDLRVYYTPQVRAVLYQAIYKMGGQWDNDALWPALYPSGLDDYQAHLQMMMIFLQGRSIGKLDGTMYDRIQEHANREPKNAFYAYMLGMWATGDLTPAVDLLLDYDVPSYVRCDEQEQCELADWLFVSSLVL